MGDICEVTTESFVKIWGGIKVCQCDTFFKNHKYTMKFDKRPNHSGSMHGCMHKMLYLVQFHISGK